MSLAFSNFCVSCISLILSLFFSSSNFFLLFLWIVLVFFLLKVAMYARVLFFFFLFVFFRFRSSFHGIFLLIRIPYVVGYPLWCRVVFSSLRRVFLGGGSVIIEYILFARVLKDWFYTVFGVVAIEVEVLLGVCGFVVDICDDLALFIFYEDV